MNMYVYVHVYGCVCAYVYVHMSVCGCVCAHVCVRVCTIHTFVFYQYRLTRASETMCPASHQLALDQCCSPYLN